jgi:STIP1 homology and U-box containing protein 1
MKAYYYLAQAQLSLQRPGEALASATRAYDMCRTLSSPSMEQLSTLVLRAKRERWDALEKERLRRKNTLLQEVEAALLKLWEAEEQEAQAIKMAEQEQPDAPMDMDREDGEEFMSEAREAYERRLREVRGVFAKAEPDGIGSREVPDYLVDNITFAIMQDPVLTKNGHSYERATLISHLRNSETDPLTRDPLTVKDLRPNLALREASATFLDANGWAVDW